MSPEELSGLPLFNGLMPEQLAHLAPLFLPVAFKADEMIFAEGARAEKVYVIEAGAVALRYRPHDGDWLTIATVDAGGVVGWSAALGRPRYTSAALCLTDLRAIAVRGSDLRAVFRADSNLAVLLLGRMALSVTNRQADSQTHIGGLIHHEVGQADRKET